MSAQRMRPLWFSTTWNSWIGSSSRRGRPEHQVGVAAGADERVGCAGSGRRRSRRRPRRTRACRLRARSALRRRQAGSTFRNVNLTKWRLLIWLSIECGAMRLRDGRGPGGGLRAGGSRCRPRPAPPAARLLVFHAPPSPAPQAAAARPVRAARHDASGLTSATLGGYVPRQMMLDIGQGARVSGRAYDPRKLRGSLFCARTAAARLGDWQARGGTGRDAPGDLAARAARDGDRGRGRQARRTWAGAGPTRSRRSWPPAPTAASAGSRWRTARARASGRSTSGPRRRCSWPSCRRTRPGCDAARPSCSRPGAPDEHGHCHAARRGPAACRCCPRASRPRVRGRAALLGHHAARRSRGRAGHHAPRSSTTSASSCPDELQGRVARAPRRHRGRPRRHGRPARRRQRAGVTPPLRYLAARLAAARAPSCGSSPRAAGLRAAMRIGVPGGAVVARHARSSPPRCGRTRMTEWRCSLGGSLLLARGSGSRAALAALRPQFPPPWCWLAHAIDLACGSPLIGQSLVGPNPQGRCALLRHRQRARDGALGPGAARHRALRSRRATAARAPQAFAAAGAAAAVVDRRRTAGRRRGRGDHARRGRGAWRSWPRSRAGPAGARSPSPCWCPCWPWGRWCALDLATGGDSHLTRRCATPRGRATLVDDRGAPHAHLAAAALEQGHDAVQPQRGRARAGVRGVAPAPGCCAPLQRRPGRAAPSRRGWRAPSPPRSRAPSPNDSGPLMLLVGAAALGAGSGLRAGTSRARGLAELFPESRSSTLGGCA